MSDKHWFVLQALTGQESKVKESIERRLDPEEMRDLIDQVLIPTEKVSEVKNGVKTTTTRKFFPGYVLVHLKLYETEPASEPVRTSKSRSRKPAPVGPRLVEKVWYFIRDTPGVIGFVGGDRTVPLRDEEVNDLLYKVEDKKEKIKPKILYDAGDKVKINDGPFMNFTGVVKTVDADRGKLKVDVEIFGRTAPVELEYWQVEKA